MTALKKRAWVPATCETYIQELATTTAQSNLVDIADRIDQRVGILRPGPEGSQRGEGRQDHQREPDGLWLEKHGVRVVTFRRPSRRWCR